MSRDTDADPAMSAKIVDLPPYGPRNADPVTDEAGAHPIEVGIGAAVTGAVGGMAAGVVAGPVGVVLGAIGGALMGGGAGKGVGEVIDVTTDAPASQGQSKVVPTDDVASERRAFRLGSEARARFPGRTFPDAESDIRAEWEADGGSEAWPAVREIVRLAFDRGCAPPAA